jgi:hypothetical protein
MTKEDFITVICPVLNLLGITKEDIENLTEARTYKEKERLWIIYGFHYGHCSIEAHSQEGRPVGWSITNNHDRCEIQGNSFNSCILGMFGLESTTLFHFF